MQASRHPRHGWGPRASAGLSTLPAVSGPEAPALGLSVSAGLESPTRLARLVGLGPAMACPVSLWSQSHFLWPGGGGRAGQVSGKSAHFSTLDRGTCGHLDRHWEPGDRTHKPSRGKGSSGGLAGAQTVGTPMRGSTWLSALLSSAWDSHVWPVSEAQITFSMPPAVPCHAGRGPPPCFSRPGLASPSCEALRESHEPR